MRKVLSGEERERIIALTGTNPALCRLLEDDRELLPFLLKDIPGAVGQRLRTEWYGHILGGLGAECGIGSGVTMYRPDQIHFGDSVTVEDDVHLDARGAGIRVGAHGQICFGSYLKNETSDGYVHIGISTYIGAHSIIFGHDGVEIGDHVLMAPQAVIVPYQHHFRSKEKLIREQGGQMEKVVIESDVYLGMAVRVLSGVRIGQGAVVGAGAVVTKDLPPYAVAFGVPARVLRYR